VATPSAGRAALARGAWAEARASFEAALAEEETAEALEGLSWAAWWLDDVDACFDARERAYRRYREDGDLRGAARLALWLSDDHAEFRRQEAVSGGWFQRAARLLADLPPAPEHGWLAAFEAHATLAAGDPDGALRRAGEARELGREHGAVDVEMFAVATEGVALVAQGAVDDGMRRLDEAAAAALGGEFDDLRAAGWTCCLLIGACEGVRDFARAAQWCAEAEAFGRRHDIRFVNGVCRAHYGAVLCWHGDWERAERELTGALAELTEKRPAWRSVAVVRLGELRRRQGRIEEALELFEAAERDPLSRLGRAAAALDRGDAAGARDEAARLLRATAAPAARAGALELLARACAVAGDGHGAATHAAELRAIAGTVPTGPLRAAASYCEGLAAAAASDHAAALEQHEEAVERYAGSEAPLETARARLGLAEALAALGRTEAARREAATAVEVLRALGAEGECGRAREVAKRLGTVPPGELSAREVEVLRLVAEGLGDRQIATQLTLSEHTVHRHVANIHAKLRCSSRAAAVALAHRRGLL
jgi:LuxR family transcriptional regulator, maltose regulon positive regulatory protein